MYPNFNNQMYMQDLQGMRDRIDRQLQQMAQMSQPQQATPITQNFQLAPNQTSSSINYAENIDDVKKELVFGDTIFVSKSFDTMWLKNARGEVKTYTLAEVIELDPKDVEIKELRSQIEELKKGMINNAEHVNQYANVKTTSTKSSTSKPNKTNDE